MEAAVHATRLYLQSLDTSKALLKLDFRYAFNSIRRNQMLMKVLELAPRLFRFVLAVLPYHPTTETPADF